MKRKSKGLGIPLVVILSFSYGVLGAEIDRKENTFYGIKAGENSLNFSSESWTRIKCITIELGTGRWDNKVEVIIEKNDGDRVTTVFNQPTQFKYLAQYLKGEMSPKDVYTKMEDSGELDISYGQHISSSKIYQFFAAYHPGYSGYHSTILNPVYQPK